MNEQKSIYLHRIRSQSSYPWLRTLSSVLAFTCYAISILFVVVGYYWGGMLVIAFLPIPLLFVICGSVVKEIVFMVADIADSITDLNCRYEQPTE